MKDSPFFLPLVFCTLSLLSFVLPTGIIAFLIIPALVLSVYSLFFSKDKRAFVRSLLLLLFVLNLRYFMSVTDGFRGVKAEKSDVTAVVLSKSEVLGDVTSFNVKIKDFFEYKPAKGMKATVLCSDLSLSAEIGDLIKAEVWFYPIERNFGNLSFLAEKYAVQFETEKFAVYGKDKLYSVSNSVRNFAFSLFERSTDNADLLSALTVGEKFRLSEEFKAHTVSAGVSHVIVVSGMHLAVVCGTLGIFLRYLRLNPVFRASLLIFFGFLIMTVCVFTPSVLRAGISLIAASLCPLFGRRSDGYVLLADSLVITLILNPFCIFGVAYQLSFAASFGIVSADKLLFYDKIPSEKLFDIKNVRDDLVELAVVSVAAFVATLPVVAVAFGEFPVMGVITNVLLSLPTTVMLVFAVLGVVLSFVGLPDVAVKPVLFVADKCASFFKTVVNYIGSLDFALFGIKDGYILPFVLAVLTAFAVIYILLERRKKTVGK